jgi:predicted alpha/beta hydrolase
MNSQPQTLTLVAADGYRLGARLYQPARPVGAVLIAPAMGVPQGYYQAFARWLCEQGHVVLTFDYRGMGESRRGPLRQLKADVFTWARQDAGAALDALAAAAPRLPLTWIGHSLGGQIPPFVPGRERLARIVTVATGSGYWKENSPELRRRVWLLWFGVAPLTLPLFGYFPGRRFGMVGDLPRGVMTQWRQWCLHPDYAVSEGEAVRAQYAAVTTPIVSLSFTDDEFMSDRNIQSIHGFYSSAPRTMTRLAPTELGLPRIGHFGFFKEGLQEALWRPYVLPALAPAA